MKLALYAHYSADDTIARHVLFYLQKLNELGFQICFISNSPVSVSGETELKKNCERIIQRENSGYDFSMWKAGLEEYDLSKCDELLLTNSSIIGPIHPLSPLWQNAAASPSDFWGLTDNDEIGRHLQSYFIVFKQNVIHSKPFTDFWRSVLPYKNKQQVIQSYEIGLTRWLEENGFKWKAIFPQGHIHSLFLKRRKLAKKLADRIYNRDLPGRNTTTLFPDLLLESGMPFLKAALLREAPMQADPKIAFQLLGSSGLPAEILEELKAKNNSAADFRK